MNNQASLSTFLNGTVEELRTGSSIVLIYLAIMIPVEAVSAYLDPSSAGAFMSLGFMVDQSLLSKGALATIAAFAAALVGVGAYYWLIAAMVQRSTSPGFYRILPFVGIMILSWLGIGFGMVLFLIPGIYLAVRWIAVLPLVLTREDKAMDTFGDSNQMTQGYGWSIFGTGLILFVAIWGVSLMVGGLGLWASGFSLVISAVIASITQNISTVLLAAFTVTVFRQLSSVDDELAEVFE